MEQHLVNQDFDEVPEELPEERVPNVPRRLRPRTAEAHIANKAHNTAACGSVLRRSLTFATTVATATTATAPARPGPSASDLEFRLARATSGFRSSTAFSGNLTRVECCEEISDRK